MTRIRRIFFSLLVLALAACAAEVPAGPAPQTILPPEQSAPVEQPRVVIYTLPTCPHCKAAKAYLTENHIAYDDREVASDKGHLGELMALFDEMGVAKAARGVPLIVVDGKTRLQGFNKDKLQKALQQPAK